MTTPGNPEVVLGAAFIQISGNASPSSNEREAVHLHEITTQFRDIAADLTSLARKVSQGAGKPARSSAISASFEGVEAQIVAPASQAPGSCRPIAEH